MSRTLQGQHGHNKKRSIRLFVYFGFGVFCLTLASNYLSFEHTGPPQTSLLDLGQLEPAQASNDQRHQIQDVNRFTSAALDSDLETASSTADEHSSIASPVQHQLAIVQERKASLALESRLDKVLHLGSQSFKTCQKLFFDSQTECLDDIPVSDRAEFFYSDHETCQKYASRSPTGKLIDAPYDFTDPSCHWLQGDKVSKACQYYCYYSDKYGFAKIPKDLWIAAQKGEKAIWIDSPDGSDRGAENREGFAGYRTLNKLKLGRVLEIGSGPFTQTTTIIDTLRAMGSDPAITEIHLADPGIQTYLKSTAHCTYRSGKLNGYPVFTHEKGGEDITFVNEFDTIVSINVIEHCRDAFEYLERMHRALRPGGFLIFHDRVYDFFLQVVHPVKHGPIEIGGLHPLRIKKRIIEVLLNPDQYRLLFYSEAMTSDMRARAVSQIPEEPIWVVAQKM